MVFNKLVTEPGLKLMTLESINCLELPGHSVPIEGKPCPLSGKVSVQACFVDRTTDISSCQEPHKPHSLQGDERGRMKLGSAPFLQALGKNFQCLISWFILRAHYRTVELWEKVPM